MVNRRRGSVLTSLGAAAAISLVSVAAIRGGIGASKIGGLFILGAPIMHAVSAALIESRTTRP